MSRIAATICIVLSSYLVAQRFYDFSFSDTLKGYVFFRCHTYPYQLVVLYIIDNVNTKEP